MMESIDRCFAVLELKSGASAEDAKKAYRDLARTWHPDRFHNSPRLQEAIDKMTEINDAYERLQEHFARLDAKKNTRISMSMFR